MTRHIQQQVINCRLQAQAGPSVFPDKDREPWCSTHHHKRTRIKPSACINTHVQRSMCCEAGPKRERKKESSGSPKPKKTLMNLAVLSGFKGSKMYVLTALSPTSSPLPLAKGMFHSYHARSRVLLTAVPTLPAILLLCMMGG